MTVLHGPLVYITDGAQRSLEHFPQVAAFAEAIGSQAIVARLQPKVDEAAAPDPHFTRALGAVVGADQPPVVVPVARRKLGAALMQYAEVRSGAVVLPAQRRFLFNSLHERLIRETPLPLLTLPRDGKIGTIRTILFPCRPCAALACCLRPNGGAVPAACCTVEYSTRLWRRPPAAKRRGT